ncbi:MAG: pilus assembly protein TadG-related protein [Candidatus Limnocylindrales bacterium]
MGIQSPRPARDERGQILVIVAGGMLALLVFLGLVIDGSNAFLNRRTAQNAADISALAGTRLIADGYVNGTTSGVNTHTGAQVYAEIQRSVEANDCRPGDATPCTWQAWFVGADASAELTDLTQVANTASALPDGALGVRVAVNRQPGTFLARLANIQTWDVNTEAIALAQTPGTAPAGYLLPIALKEGSFSPGQVYDLTDGKDAPGGFGWLSWTGSNSAGGLATSLCTPDNPAFSLPRTFPVDPGKTNASSVRACLDKWITSGQTVLIPIYETVSGHGDNAKYAITGIAAFVLSSRDQPAVDNIRGYFVRVYSFVDQVPAGVTTPPQPGDTTYFLGLVR